MKKYLVNENCIGCGLCESVCPEVFKLKGDELAHVIMDEVPKELVDKADEAKVSCPVDAIEDKSI